MATTGDQRPVSASGPETLEIPVWVKRGVMLLRRDALDADDPDHTYNYIKQRYSVEPEDYGISRPTPWGGK